MLNTTTGTYCIIGAGASGIAAGAVLKGRGIPFEILEREADLGGLWNIATPSGIVYESTHLISSISATGFHDMPMLDEDYPEYPRHDRILGYLRDYAHKHALTERIRFGATVETVTPSPTGTWAVQIKGERAPRTYAGVIIANGHHEKHRMPTYPGTFAGEILHSKQYKSARQVRDKRLLVVGAGNSAADIVRDAAHASEAKLAISMRHGQWFVPKFMLGFPTGDLVGNVEWALTPLPRAFKRRLFQAALWLLQGPPSRYRMPDPDHSIDQTHPTMSDEIPRLVAHGRLQVVPEIARYDGHDVVFADGTRDAFDAIVFATGYDLSIPFLQQDLYLGPDGKPSLYLNTASPSHPGLFFAGLIQANGSIWRLAALQAEIIANAIVARHRFPQEEAAFMARAHDGAGPASRRTYVASARHKLEANYFDYTRALKREARRFRKAARHGLDGSAAGDRSVPDRAGERDVPISSGRGMERGQPV